MPHTITLVVWGRCRPSPDRVALGAPPDRDARSIVPGDLPGCGGQGLLPVLGTPPPAEGKRRVHGDDRHPQGVGHRHQPGPQPSGGKTTDQLPEAFPPSVLFPGLVRGEVQVLHRDGPHTLCGGPAQQPGQGMTYLRVPVLGVPGQLEGEPARVPDRVAVGVESPGGQVVDVGVHPDHPAGQRRLPRHLWDRGGGPGRAHIPPTPIRIQVEAVGHRPVGLDPISPLRAPVGEGHPTREHVPATGRVGQMRQRSGQPDRDLPLRGDADGLVAVAFAGLTISGQEEALGLPPSPSLGLGEPGPVQVAAAGQRPLLVGGLGQGSGPP